MFDGMNTITACSLGPPSPRSGWVAPPGAVWRDSTRDGPYRAGLCVDTSSEIDEALSKVQLLKIQMSQQLTLVRCPNPISSAVCVINFLEDILNTKPGKPLCGASLRPHS